MEDKAKREALLRRFAGIEGRKMLVHGGGRSATELAKRLQVDVRMVDGRRITSPEMLTICTQVYAGEVNKGIVAFAGTLGLRALGLTGVDMQAIISHKREAGAVDFGLVGDVDQVNGSVFNSLLCSGITPVIAPLTVDKAGQILNTNADTIAKSVAVEMAKTHDVRLVFAFEKSGVLADSANEESAIHTICQQDAQRLKQDGTIQGGMLVKVENALDAVLRGVKEVVITSYNDLQGLNGTHIL